MHTPPPRLRLASKAEKAAHPVMEALEIFWKPELQGLILLETYYS